MKAIVDQDTCSGCALCVSMCDSVFSMNDEGVSEAIATEIDATLVDDVTEARDCCPVDAISIEE